MPHEHKIQRIHAIYSETKELLSEQKPSDLIKHGVKRLSAARPKSQFTVSYENGCTVYHSVTADSDFTIMADSPTLGYHDEGTSMIGAGTGSGSHGTPVRSNSTLSRSSTLVGRSNSTKCGESGSKKGKKHDEDEGYAESIHRAQQQGKQEEEGSGSDFPLPLYHRTPSPDKSCSIFSDASRWTTAGPGGVSNLKSAGGARHAGKEESIFDKIAMAAEEEDRRLLGVVREWKNSAQK